MERHVLLLLLGLTTCFSAICADNTLVLNESAYCRSHAQFRAERISPESLRDTKLELLKQDLGRVKTEVLRNAAYWGVKPTEENWQEYYYPEIQWLQYGGSRGAVDPFIVSEPPPADWVKPGFDDSGWLLQRQPMMVGPHGLGPGGNFYRRAVYTRYCFLVPDPATAGALKLSLMYYGGIRVFLNGQEIGRSHLPQGELGPDTPGEAYPLGAYARVAEDGSLIVVKGRKDSDSYVILPETLGSFEDYPQAKDSKGHPIPDVAVLKRKVNASRKDFEQAKKLRDRTLALDIPVSALQKDVNVLCVEVRASDLHRIAVAGGNDFTTPSQGDVAWSHGQLCKMSLTATGTVPMILDRPAGVQVWATEMHRTIISPEFLPFGVVSGILRFVGAANGSFSGQIVVGTDKELSGLKLTPSDLKSESGAVIPAAALLVRPMTGKPLSEWSLLGEGRGGIQYCTDPLSAGGAELAAHRFQLKKDELKNHYYFDAIEDDPAQPPIPANSCRPSWVTLKVPAETPKGVYKGLIRVEAAGLKPVDVPIQAEVYSYRVPEPQFFQAHAAIEQSPYGVVTAYKMPLWSAEHFKFMEGSFRHLARLGNDWLNIPVINFTEFGNVNDSMIKWIRKPDGKLSWDYTILDQYLSMAVKHLGKPRVINFVIMHGTGGFEADVQVKDERSGKEETLKLGSAQTYYAETWKAFAVALRMHMRDLDLEKSMFWGYMWDSTADAELLSVLRSVCPDVWWTKGAHRGKEIFEVRAFSQLLPFHMASKSQLGWKNPWFHVDNPRGGGSLLTGSGTCYPFNFRMAIDRSLVQGMNGIGRIGADYFGDTYIKGLKSEGFLRAGMPHHNILYPGKNGVISSARFEALIEGYQETEARIFMEQLMDRKALSPDLAKKAEDVLTRHHRETLAVPSMAGGWLHVEQMTGWQERSRRLYGVASEVADAVAVDLSAFQINADVSARGQVTVPFAVRGWTSAARDWTIETADAWIKPAKTQGTSKGHESVPITLDVTKLPPAQTAKGTFTVKDMKSGQSATVTVTANVDKVLDYVYETDAFNRAEFLFIPDEARVQVQAEIGSEVSDTLYFFNKSTAEIAWQASPALPWISIEPSSGKAGPGQMITVTLKAKPGGADEGFRESTITLSEAGGEKEEIKLAVYALQPYAPPAALPAGKAEPLNADLHKALLKSRKERKPKWCNHEVLYVADVQPGHKERGEDVVGYLSMPGPSETVYNLEGKGFKAFSARVDLPDNYKGYKYWAGVGGAKFEDWTAARFEIYVDGKLAAYSGWIGKTSPSQTLVATGLENAKTLKLVTRFKKVNAQAVTVAWWNPTFYR